MTIESSHRRGEQTHIEYKTITSKNHEITGGRLYPKNEWNSKFMPIVKFFAWARNTTCNVTIDGEDYVLVRESLRDFVLPENVPKKHFSDTDVRTILQHVLGKKVHLTNEVIRPTIEKLTKKVANLKYFSAGQIPVDQIFVLHTRKEIIKQKGICLNASKDDERYRGIAVFKVDDKWILNPCQGTITGSDISADDFNKLMSEAISELQIQNIVPDFYTYSQPHDKSNLVNFNTWQEQHR